MLTFPTASCPQALLNGMEDNDFLKPYKAIGTTHDLNNHAALRFLRQDWARSSVRTSLFCVSVEGFGHVGGRNLSRDGTLGLLEPDFKHAPVSDKFKEQPLSPTCKIIDIHACIPLLGHRVLLCTSFYYPRVS